MNIQRTYSILSDIIHNHRKNTKTTMTNAEILYYLHKENIFTFDPQHINNGVMKESEILSYYGKVSQDIIAANDDTSLLEGIECDDEMHEYINIKCFKSGTMRIINPDLEGEQQDCPKGDRTKIEIDAPLDRITSIECKGETQGPQEHDVEKENDNVEILVNKTYASCKTFFFPLLALISRKTGIRCFKEILVCERTTGLIRNLLIDKKIDLRNNNYTTIVNIMNVIDCQ